MSNSIRGRCAIVTGAASGIGEATARRFAAEGAQVLAVDLNVDRLAEVATVSGIEPFGIDITLATAADSIVAEADGRWGKLDILFNGAGVAGFAFFETHPDDLWQHTLAVNLEAAFRLTRAAIKLLRKSDQARIINIGSILSTFGDPGLVAYTVSKHGILGLTRALASELGPERINVNCIQPGAILTGITRPFFSADPEYEKYWTNKPALRRMGMPDDIASVAFFLAGDDARFVTGQGIMVDGGAMARSSV
jgi:3-oxoacyl-[acyl-carrier protein] reductase